METLNRTDWLYSNDAKPGDDYVTCDICGRRESVDDLTPDWNGETGCHISCEAVEDFYAWRNANMPGGE